MNYVINNFLKTLDSDRIKHELVKAPPPLMESTKWSFDLRIGFSQYKSIEWAIGKSSEGVNGIQSTRGNRDWVKRNQQDLFFLVLRQMTGAGARHEFFNTKLLLSSNQINSTILLNQIAQHTNQHTQGCFNVIKLIVCMQSIHLTSTSFFRSNCLPRNRALNRDQLYLRRTQQDGVRAEDLDTRYIGTVLQRAQATEYLVSQTHQSHRLVFEVDAMLR